MRKSIYFLLAIFLVFVSCSLEEEIIDTNLSSEADYALKKGKVDVCHYDADTDTWETLNINENALDAHLNHGDKRRCGYTYVPDDNFELALIEYGYDALPLDDYVLTANINTVLSLDVQVRGISDLTGIEDFVSLTFLNCWANQLTSLDVSKNVALTWLSCGDNQLTSLDVSKNIALTRLVINDTQLTTIDISKNVALTYLYCHNTPLTSLDVSKNIALTNLNASLTQLTSLDVSKNVALTDLSLVATPLTSLDVSKNVALFNLLLYSCNSLSSLNIKSGHNYNLGLYMSNTSLNCIEVDVPSLGLQGFRNYNGGGYGGTFSDDCGY